MKTAMTPALLVSLSIAYLLTSLSCLIASAPSLLVPTEDVNLKGVKFIVLLKKKREREKKAQSFPRHKSWEVTGRRSERFSTSTFAFCHVMAVFNFGNNTNLYFMSA